MAVEPLERVVAATWTAARPDALQRAGRRRWQAERAL